jgi:hypothetical protein
MLYPIVNPLALATTIKFAPLVAVALVVVWAKDSVALVVAPSKI